MVRKQSGKKPTHLGAAIVNSQRRQAQTQRQQQSVFHTTGLDEGANSIVDRTDLDEFLQQAMIAQEQFLVERRQTHIVNMDSTQQNSATAANQPPSANSTTKLKSTFVQPNMYAEVEDDGEDSSEFSDDLDSDEDASDAASSSSTSALPEFDEIRIPRRPDWHKYANAEQLDRAEREAFLQWRRQIAQIEEQVHDQSRTRKFNDLTPFEKNIEVWRQLWRVVERCEILIQILDARNPLLYYNQDVERYAHEIDSNKQCLLILNKADYLTPYARQQWAEYFKQNNIQFVFFSAALEQKRIDALNKQSRESFDAKHNDDEVKQPPDTQDEPTTYTAEDTTSILNRHQLFDYVRQQAKAMRSIEHADDRYDHSARIQVGMVGFPNVGKSSTINALVGSKKVSVAATPGKTKHFQTINVTDDITLCDCPGLVFPSLATTRAELVVNGVLPIDQLKTYTNIVEPVQLVCNRIDRHQWQAAYSLTFPEDMDPIPAMIMLNAHARVRGYTKDHGRPDESRSARIVLKDYTKGKILYAHPPPTLTPKQIRQWHQSYADDLESIVSTNNTKQTEHDPDSHSNKPGASQLTAADLDAHLDELAAADGSMIDLSDDDDDELDDDALADNVSVTSSVFSSLTGNRKVNRMAMHNAIEEQADPLQLSRLTLGADSKNQRNAAGQPMTEKQLRRAEFALKRNRKGKSNKLRAVAASVPQEQVAVRVGGNSDAAMQRMAFGGHKYPTPK